MNATMPSLQVLTSSTFLKTYKLSFLIYRCMAKYWKAVKRRVILKAFQIKLYNLWKLFVNVLEVLQKK